MGRLLLCSNGEGVLCRNDRFFHISNMSRASQLWKMAGDCAAVVSHRHNHRQMALQLQWEEGLYHRTL
jgi:hypothetical protein